MAAQSEPGTEQGRGPAVIGLHPAAGDEGIGAIGHGRGQDELQLAHLVAGLGTAGEVVPLDPDAGSTQALGEPLQQLERGRPLGQLQPRRVIRQPGSRGNHAQMAFRVPLGSTAWTTAFWNLSSTLSATCSTTKSSSILITLPRIPLLVTTSSPLARPATRAACSFWRLRWGRMAMK